MAESIVKTFLDKTGVGILWNKILAKINPIEDEIEDINDLLDIAVYHDNETVITDEVVNNYYTKAQIDQLVDAIDSVTSSLVSAEQSIENDISDINTALDTNENKFVVIDSLLDNAVYQSDAGSTSSPINENNYYSKSEMDSKISSLDLSISSLQDSVSIFIYTITQLSDLVSNLSNELNSIKEQMLHISD